MALAQGSRELWELARSPAPQIRLIATCPCLLEHLLPVQVVEQAQRQRVPFRRSHARCDHPALDGLSKLLTDQQQAGIRCGIWNPILHRISIHTRALIQGNDVPPSIATPLPFQKPRALPARCDSATPETAPEVGDRNRQHRRDLPLKNRILRVVKCLISRTLSRHLGAAPRNGLAETALASLVQCSTHQEMLRVGLVVLVGLLVFHQYPLPSALSPGVHTRKRMGRDSLPGWTSVGSGSHAWPSAPEALAGCPKSGGVAVDGHQHIPRQNDQQPLGAVG